MPREAFMGNAMRLALIGMSGSGKTFWTKKLSEKGAPAIFCDDQIEQRLAPRLRGMPRKPVTGNPNRIDR